ncbi:MAG: hypothetical protein HYW49_01055 [Deltaproteobacteria bacterium]|nr:hypothetical protein [Deltaproteobacteria bacterium]
MVYFPDWIASLFNTRCPFCGALFGERAAACGHCVEKIARLETRIQKAGAELEISARQPCRSLRIHSLATYEGWVKDLILASKSDPNPHVTRFFAEAFWRILPEEARGLAIVWTPGKHFGSVHLVEALALELHRRGARLTDRPAFSRKILRSRPQKTLRISERKAADRAGRFRIASKILPNDISEVVLLDDVCTTGATLTGLATALEEETGLLARHALVIAHTPLRMNF